MSLYYNELVSNNYYNIGYDHIFFNCSIILTKSVQTCLTLGSKQTLGNIVLILFMLRITVDGMQMELLLSEAIVLQSVVY